MRIVPNHRPGSWRTASVARIREENARLKQKLSVAVKDHEELVLTRRRDELLHQLAVETVGQNSLGDVIKMSVEKIMQMTDAGYGRFYALNRVDGKMHLIYGSDPSSVNVFTEPGSNEYVVPLQEGTRCVGIILVGGEARPIIDTELFLDLETAAAYIAIKIGQLQRLETMLVLEHRAGMVETVGPLGHAIKNMLVALGGLIDNQGSIQKVEGLLEVGLACARIYGLKVMEQALSQGLVGIKTQAQGLVARHKLLENVRVMVQTMLAFTKVGSGEKVRVNVREELSLVDCLTHQMAVDNQVDLSIDLGCLDGSEHVRMEKGFLIDVVYNLIKNGIEAFEKNREEGKTIKVQAAIDEQTNQLQIIVSDNGPGIPPAIAANIFRTQTYSAKQGGVGLGLLTVHLAVTGAGGTVDVDSSPQTGTTFTINLPLVCSAEKIDEQAKLMPVNERLSPEQAKTITIMVVDDNDLIRELIGEHLITRGFDNRLVFKFPDEAAAKYKSLEKKPQIVITDMNMEGRNGKQLVEAMIESTNGVGPTKFIIFSGASDLATQGDNVYFVEKSGRLTQLMETVNNIARGFIGGNEAAFSVPAVLPAKTEEKIEPEQAFAQRIAHNLNNLLMAINFSIDLQDHNIYKVGEKRLSGVIVALKRFCLEQGREINDLMEALDGDPIAKQLWTSVPTDERYKLAIIGQLLLDNGLEKTLQEIRFFAEDKTSFVNSAETIQKTIACLAGLCDAVHQKNGVGGELLRTRFADYYKILRTKSST